MNKFLIILAVFMLVCSCSANLQELDKTANSAANPDSGTSDEPPAGQDKPEQTEPDEKVHPRLFINYSDVAALRANAKGRDAALYGKIRNRIDNLIPQEITFVDPLAATGESNTNHEYGYRASEAALVWLVEQDKKYLDYTKLLIRKLTEYYQMRVDNNLNIAWYIYSTICTLVAYDWIYNDLTTEERASYGQALYRAGHGIAWHGPGIRPSRYRENISDHKSGMYGPAVLPWYLGLTFKGEGIDDAECESMIEKGYALYMQMAEFRKEMAGEKGGGATACAQYAFGYYPIADFCFIYTNRTARGEDMSEEMDYVLKYMDYLDWIRLPENKEYGFGDVNHYNCMLPHTDINYHIAEIFNIYGEKHPEIAEQASRLAGQYNQAREIDIIPFIRLLHKRKIDAGSGTSPAGNHSIYFDTMGQVYMRSGTGDNDTYAMFVSGGLPTQHKHYDNNNFIIYKNGYRALDSGTRPEPGWHLPYYFARTVAHNCVTIRMPGEVLPKYWGGPAANEEQNLPIPNDGGQCELLASELLAHKETKDYVYLASDATGSYHKDKAKLVMREFIYIMPDIFVIYDRVESTDASYPKRWLIHTALEPELSDDGMSFTETSKGGRMICKTLFPQNAVLEKTGGPEKNFWNDGRNWTLPVFSPEDYGYANRNNIPPSTWPEVGQWRIEVAPGTSATKDHFMHLIQVGDPGLKTLPQTATFENSNAVGVRFDYEGRRFELSFDKSKNYGCTISVIKN